MENVNYSLVFFVFRRELGEAGWEEAGVSKILVFDWFFEAFRSGQGGCRGVENLSFSTGLKFFEGTVGAEGARGLENLSFSLNFNSLLDFSIKFNQF